MEEKTPTMPGVVFLKYLKITGKCAVFRISNNGSAFISGLA